MKASHLPARIAAGGYILHAGLQKWKGDEALAEGLHGMAKGAYPVVADVEPPKFLRLLAGTEIAVGAALLTPIVPSRLAGAALTAFSGGLLGMYARTPELRQPGSIWPSQKGTAVSKDAWLFGIGLSLLTSGRRR